MQSAGQQLLLTNSIVGCHGRKRFDLVGYRADDGRTVNEERLGFSHVCDVISKKIYYHLISRFLL